MNFSWESFPPSPLGFCSFVSECLRARSILRPPPFARGGCFRLCLRVHGCLLLSLTEGSSRARSLNRAAVRCFHLSLHLDLKTFNSLSATPRLNSCSPCFLHVSASGVTFTFSSVVKLKRVAGAPSSTIASQGHSRSAGFTLQPVGFEGACSIGSAGSENSNVTFLEARPRGPQSGLGLSCPSSLPAPHLGPFLRPSQGLVPQWHICEDRARGPP